MDNKVKFLEAKVRELERLLDIEKKHNIEAQKQVYKKERRIKELTLEAEDFKLKFLNTHKRLEDLESDFRVQKRKLEEAQEICTLNQNRFRKSHQMYLEECGKAEQYEEQLRRRRAVMEKTSLFVQV